MKVIRTILEMHEVASRCRQEGKTLGCVPTMGYLHEGHLALIRSAHAQTDEVTVTLFVNPTQFGPHEDFEQYPRNEERDLTLLEKEDVDWVFIPAYDEIYPDGFSTYIEPPLAAKHWCGKSRPVHFKGVCTVVAVLFHIIQPTHAFFGQKDAQQCAVIRSMVRDLHIPVIIQVIPTVREADGLALSSRNQYLAPQERQDALILYHALQTGQNRFAQGETNAARLVEEGKTMIKHQPNIRLDYLAVVEEKSFQAVDFIEKGNFYIGAIYAGGTRLIDNIRFV